MEFFLGSITSLVCAYVMYGVAAKISDAQPRNLRVVSSQSQRIEMLKRYGVYTVSMSHEQDPIKTQATDFHDSKETRVVLNDDWAYWVENGQLMHAVFDGKRVDQLTKKRVDTMSLNSVELLKMSVIVEKLTERFNDEDSDPRNSKF